MKRSKTIKKRSLTMSVIVLCLCVAALIGGTFAWFTDTASTSVNRIVAGTLDVDLVMADTYNGDYVSIADEEGDIFSAGTTANESNETLWEPGATHIAYLGVKNNGSLALKYNIHLDVTDDGLASALEYAIVPFGKSKPTAAVESWSAAKAAAGTMTGTITAGHQVVAENGCLDEIANGTQGETDYFALVVHMNEEAGNEYQGKDVVIDVNIVASQKDAEYDSFNNTYDAAAEFPVVAEAKVVAGKATVLKGYDDNGTLAAQAVIPADAVTGISKIEMTVDEVQKPESISVDENDVTLSLDVKFFSVDESGNRTQITDFGSAVVNVDLSAQIPSGKTLAKVFHTHGTSSTELEAVASTENVTEGKYYYDSSTKMLTIASSTFSPFTLVMKAVTYEVVATKTGETSIYMMLDEFSNSVKEGNTYEGWTVTQLKDIDLAGKTWTPIGYYYEYYSYDYSTWKSTTISEVYKPFKGTYDGANYVIKNLCLTDPTWLGEATAGNNNYEDYYLGLFGFTYGGEIKNVTIQDSTLTASNYGPYGMLVAEAYGTNLTNCNINNCSYTGAGMGGLLVDYLYYGTAKNCSVDGLSSLNVTAGSYSAGIAAYCYKATVDSCVSNASITGSKCCAGVVGNCYQSTVNNCTNNGTIHSTGASNNDSFVGGVVGVVSSATVTNCINTGNVSTNGINSPASGVIGQNPSSNLSTIEKCINTGNVSGVYAAGIIVSLYGNTTPKYCYNSGTLTGSQYADGICGGPVYGNKKGDATNSLNAGAQTAPTKTSVAGNTATNCYYYDGATLKTAASNETVTNIDTALSALNTGLETPFWGNDNGVIKPVALISE